MPSLAWAMHDGADCLVLRGLSPDVMAQLGPRSDADLARALRVMPAEVVDAAGRSNLLQAMPGRYRVGRGEIRFSPQFPFVAGTAYAMVIREPVLSGGPVVLRITRPGIGGTPTTEVIQIAPTTSVLPRNALRFYLRFSAPMSEGLAARHVRLERAGTGAPIEGAFSPMDFELWDRSRRRLTVLLDPARIKQGLAPHEEAGYPLEEGTAVVLVVERGLLDAAGRPLVGEYRQRYEIGPDLRSRVEPAAWALTIPAAEGRRPLVVAFGRPLDRALLEDCLTVVGPEGTAHRGAAAIAVGEGSWSFVPDDPWIPGPARLLVDPVLEDLSGNSVTRVFDRDLERREHEPVAGGAVSVPFIIPGG